MLNKKRYLNEEKGIAAFLEFIQRKISKVEKSILKSTKNLESDLDDLNLESTGIIGTLCYELTALKAIYKASITAEKYISEDEQNQWIKKAVRKAINDAFPFQMFAVDGIMWFCENVYFKKMNSYI